MFARIALVSLVFLALSTAVQADIVAGHDYMVLEVPQPQAVNGKIEVIEFFSWGCPHCDAFSPMLTRWLATLPKDVTFRRVPVGLGHPEWDSLVRAYYALQSTGDLARLDSPIFDAIHRQHVSLFDEQSITAWVGKHKVNVAKFKQAFQSFGVNTSVGQSEESAERYRVTGVPMLAIGGRYTVSSDHEKMLAVSDELIAKVRAEDKKAEDKKPKK
jgi:protein dithiol oxidoreductase (disulfide-forming)